MTGCHQLVAELSQGMAKARELRRLLNETAVEEEDQVFLLQMIISSFEKALGVLKAPASSPSAYESKGARSYARDGNGSKKRKLQTTWTREMRVDSGSEGPAEDGYTWRKYGQKEILGSKHPRSYYRCTHKYVRNCLATKQVQRSDEDGAGFDVKYIGTHSCDTVPNPTEPSFEKRSSSSFYHQGEYQNDILQSMKTNLKVETDMEETAADSFFTGFARNEQENYCSPISALFDETGSFCSSTTLADDGRMSAYSSPAFQSPATSRTNYFCDTSYHTGEYKKVQLPAETQVPETASGHVPTTISPSEGMDEAILDPRFTMDISEILEYLS